MAEYIYFHKNFFLIVLVLLLVLLIGYFGKDSLCFECMFKKEEFQSMKFPVQQLPSSELENNGMMIYNQDPKLASVVNRTYNPLEYPYKSDYFYDQSWYPNLKLPFQVIGGGRRMTPTLGGTQVAILNPPTPIQVDESNIAPVNISTRGPIGRGQQMGVIYKIFGTANDILPLYGRKRYPNDNQYDYWTLMGPYGVKVPVVTKNRNDELGNNDVVFIQNVKEPYRVTIYEQDLPAYIPYV